MWRWHDRRTIRDLPVALQSPSTGESGTHPAFRESTKEVLTVYSILYIIGAIVVIIVVLRLLGLY